MEDLTNWPKKSGRYTVVQMYVDDEPIVRFADEPSEYFFHATVIKLLAKSLGRECPKKNVSRGREISAPESDWYKVIGAGKAIVDAGEKTADFYGRSGDYDIPINLEHLDSIRPLYPNWKINSR